MKQRTAESEILKWTGSAAVRLKMRDANYPALAIQKRHCINKVLTRKYNSKVWLRVILATCGADCVVESMHVIRFKMLKIVVAVFILFCVVEQSCAGVRSPGSTLRKTPVYPESVIEEADEATEKLDPVLLKYADKEVLDYLEAVGKRLEKHLKLGSLEISYSIINSLAVNAYSFSNGNIYITSGLLILLETEGQLAAVLAHELAHIAGGHFYDLDVEKNRISKEKKNRLIYIGVAEEEIELYEILKMMKYSRENEKEADWASLKIMTDAGYHPLSCPELIDILARHARYVESFLDVESSELSEKDRELFSSHPNIDDREKFIARKSGGYKRKVRDTADSMRPLTNLVGRVIAGHKMPLFLQGKRIFHRSSLSSINIGNRTVDAELRVNSGRIISKNDTVFLNYIDSKQLDSFEKILEQNYFDYQHRITGKQGNFMLSKGISRVDGKGIQYVAGLKLNGFHLIVAGEDRNIVEQVIDSARPLTEEEVGKASGLVLKSVPIEDLDEKTRSQVNTLFSYLPGDPFDFLNGGPIDKRNLKKVKYLLPEK